MALADSAEARARDVDSHGAAPPPALPPAPLARAGSGGEGEGGEGAEEAARLEALLRRTEEAELAAAVQTRRAAAAEGELHAAKAQLADAQRQVKELSWQIQMSFGPSTIGGVGAGGAARAAGMTGWTITDMIGLNACGANFVRKPRDAPAS
jgi:hypothetical protein